MNCLVSRGLILAMAVLGAAGPARADVVLASNFSPPASSSGFDINVGFAGSTTGGVFTNEAAGQEFEATASGVISTVLATVDHFDPGGVSLIVTVTDAAGSVPGAVLGSASFSPSQVSSIDGITNPTSFDLSADHIALQAGQDYFVTFTVATPTGSPAYRADLLGGSNPSGFGIEPVFSRDGGATWGPEGVVNEIGLTINGNPAVVPEPSSLAIMLTLTGSAGAIRLLRRRRR